MPTQFRRTSRHRGIAMLAALFLCGVVTVLSLAMLAASSAQVRAVDNAARAARADALADSGATLAMYYLLHPEKSPVLLVQASMVDTLYYPGEMNVPLGADGGTADVYVVMVRPYEYRITATGRDGGGEIARRKICEVAVKVDSKPQHAGAFAGGATLDSRWSIAGPGTEVGGVRLEGDLLGNLAPATLTGPVYAANGAAVPGATALPAFPRAGGQPLSRTLYAGRMNAGGGGFAYTYAGAACHAQLLSGDVSGTLRDISPTNPANVWYADNEIQIKSATTLNGTLIVRNKQSLRLKANLTITPLPGMPALVVEGTLRFDEKDLTLTSRGYTYVGERIEFKGDDRKSVLDVRGALAVGESAAEHGPAQNPVSPDKFKTAIRLTYDPSVLDLPDFTVPRDAVPVSIEITKWDIKS